MANENEDDGRCEGFASHGMALGDAIKALKHNYKVAREGWNGVGMFLMLCTPPSDFYALESSGVTYRRQPYIYIKTADGSLVPWTASQTDILAEDYVIVEDSH